MDAGKNTNNTLDRALTPQRAVWIGHLVVNLPVCAIISTAAILGFSFGRLVWGYASLFLSALVAWAWWSFSIPRWRDWVKKKGANEEITQSIAVRTGLIWPKGHIFEKTELPRRKKA
jgi:hypothetical protein